MLIKLTFLKMSIYKNDLPDIRMDQKLGSRKMPEGFRHIPGQEEGTKT